MWRAVLVVFVALLQEAQVEAGNSIENELAGFVQQFGDLVYSTPSSETGGLYSGTRFIVFPPRRIVHLDFLAGFQD